MPMNNEIFNSIVDAVFDECKRVMKEKGASYTKGDDNKLANFERQAARRGRDPREIIAVYQDKHRDAIDGFLFNGIPVSEEIEANFVDDINYDLLMLAETIAVGYVPTSGWLFEALCKGAGITVEEGRASLAKVESMAEAPQDEAEPPSVAGEAPTPIRPGVEPTEGGEVAAAQESAEQETSHDPSPSAGATPSDSEQFHTTGEVCCNPGGSGCCDGGSGELKPGAQITREGRTSGVRHARGRVKSKSKQAEEKAKDGDQEDSGDE